MNSEEAVKLLLFFFGEYVFPFAENKAIQHRQVRCLQIAFTYLCQEVRMLRVARLDHRRKTGSAELVGKTVLEFHW